MILGFTTELVVLAIGELAMSVNAALTGWMAQPIPRTSAMLVRIELVGEVRFMIAPAYKTDVMDQ
jgi:hypothetical protein